MNTSDFVIWCAGVSVTLSGALVAIAVYRLGNIIKAIWADHRKYDL